MGNQAFITAKGANLGVQLHWNGGRDSVEAFLEYAKLAKLPPLGERNEGLPALVTVLCNYFGNDGMNVRISSCYPHRPDLSDSGDNGVYVVEGFKIVARYGGGVEQRVYELEDMLKAIDNAQPKADQIGIFLDGIETPVDQLKVGDQVILPRRYGDVASEGRFQVFTVLGFRPPIYGRVNGENLTGKPYVDMFDDSAAVPNMDNINAYIRTETVRVPK
jgi:hypothetical protein